MKVVVCGGRDFVGLTAKNAVFYALDQFHASRPITRLIEGGQRTYSRQRTGQREIVGGADYWANQWAEARGVKCKTMGADWRKHGRAAGPIRNQGMILEGPEVVLAFPGGSGTNDMVKRALASNVEVVKFNKDGDADDEPRGRRRIKQDRSAQSHLRPGRRS